MNFYRLVFDDWRQSISQLPPSIEFETADQLSRTVIDLRKKHKNQGLICRNAETRLSSGHSARGVVFIDTRITGIKELSLLQIGRPPGGVPSFTENSSLFPAASSFDATSSASGSKLLNRNLHEYWSTSSGAPLRLQTTATGAIGNIISLETPLSNKPAAYRTVHVEHVQFERRVVVTYIYEGTEQNIKYNARTSLNLNLLKKYAELHGADGHTAE